MINIQEIKSASHTLFVTDNSSFANTSALYSYALTLHKKVSIHTTEKIEQKLSFLPWFDKSRMKAPSSAEFIVEVESNTVALYEFFKQESIKINKKMATALYAGLIQEYDAFQSKECNGTIFAIASELVTLGAEYKECSRYMVNSLSLASFRLKSLLYKSMQLKDEAKVALLLVSDEDLKASGAEIVDAYKTMKEVLKMVNVEEVRLLKKDENNKILKIIKDN